MENEKIEYIGDNHISTSVQTPLRPDAFDKSDEEKIENIKHHFGKIMEELGLDLSDDSLAGTPSRVAKMYVKELFYGLNPKNRPSTTTFNNKYNYKKMLIEQDIVIDSACEHHFLPMIGYAHVGYIPNEKVIGLSKLNRLVDYYAHRPQVQERLCEQICNDLQRTLGTESVIVVIHSKHLCVSSRGIKDKSSFTTSVAHGGDFEEESFRNEFYELISMGKV